MSYNTRHNGTEAQSSTNTILANLIEQAIYNMVAHATEGNVTVSRRPINHYHQVVIVATVGQRTITCVYESNVCDEMQVRGTTSSQFEAIREVLENYHAWNVVRY